MRTRSKVVASCAALLLAGGVIAGCGSSGKSSGGSGNSKVVVVGLSTPLSGPGSVYGVASSGIRAYFNTINASGGVNGYTFKVVEEDNQYQPAKAASTARDLVSKGAFVIISEGTPSYDGIKQVAAQLKVPALVAANGDLFKPPPAPNLFGENPPYSGESENLFRFVLQNLKIKKVGLAWENDDVGSPASKNAPGYVQQNGGQLVSSQAISNGTTDYSPFCQKFQAAGAQAVEGFLISTGLAGLQKACAAIGYKPVWVSPFFSFAPEYLALAGSASEGTYIDSYQYSLDSDQPGVTEYKQAMMKYFPKDVESAFAEQGYAFAQAVSDAVSTATTGGKTLTQSAFLSGLTINNQQVGLIPGFTYDSTTHQGAAELAIFQVQNGSFVQKTDFQALPAAVAASS